jgi:hypothetical protein
MVDSKRTGNKYTYKMACGGQRACDDGRRGGVRNGRLRSKMRMTMTKTKESMQMTYSGQRIGSCTATK